MAHHSNGFTLLRGVKLAVAAWTFFIALTGQAATMPDMAALAQTLQSEPQPLTVIEPHLSTRDQPVQVQYLGWRAEVVLDSVLGAAAWRKPGVDVEFRALDGYVSRIPAERFTQYQAYWVVARVGQGNQRQFIRLGDRYWVRDGEGAAHYLAQIGFQAHTERLLSASSSGE